MQPSQHSDAVALLKRAIEEQHSLDDLPDALRPETLDAAYAIQISLAERCGGVGGWKVAPAKPGREPVCSAVPTMLVALAPHTLHLRNAPWPKMEVELALRLREDIEGEVGGITRGDIENAIGSVHPAIEIVQPRFLEGAEISELSSLADLHKCGGIIVGAGRTDWRSLDFTTVPMSLYFDDACVGTANGGPALDVVLDTLVWLANHAARYKSPLKAGQTIITGARVKPVTLEMSDVTLKADVEGFPSLVLHVTG